LPGIENAIGHASRSYGRGTWAGKPAGIPGVSVGVIATAVAQRHPRNGLAYLEMPTFDAPEAFVNTKDGLFGEAGNIEPSSVGFSGVGWTNMSLGRRGTSANVGHA
jgi:chromate reductase